MQKNGSIVADESGAKFPPREAILYPVVLALLTYPALLVVGISEDRLFTSLALLPTVVIAVSIYPRGRFTADARRLLGLSLGLWLAAFMGLALIGFTFFSSDIVLWAMGVAVASVPNVVLTFLIGRTSRRILENE